MNIQFTFNKIRENEPTSIPTPQPIPQTPRATEGTLPPPRKLDVSITRDTGWGSGYNGNITITSGDKDIANWKLQCRTTSSITWASGVKYTFIDGIIELTPERWFEQIKKNTTVTFGFGGVTDLTFISFVETEPSVPQESVNGSGVIQQSITFNTDTSEISKRRLKVSLNEPLIIQSSENITDVFWNNHNVFNVTRRRDRELIITMIKSGRGCLKVKSANGERYIGIVCGNGTDISEVPISMVSEDDPMTSMTFWKDFEKETENKRCEGRYVYINGGPGDYGWKLNYSTTEWNLEVLGKRALNFIRNSQILGMVPTLVYYNIPAGNESYPTNNENLQSAVYMDSYFKDLIFLLNMINKENPDDLTRIILEPDAIGYQMQNSGRKLSELLVRVDSAYTSGVLDSSDPVFPNTNAGLIQAINYLIHKKCPQCEFGWQINAWSNPVSIPGGIGICKSSDFIPNFEQAKAFIKKTAEDTAKYYLEGGIGSHGASFFSIDKYGLEWSLTTADKNPIPNAWAFNNDHWNNYLLYAKSLKDTINLPCVLWQLPVGRSNGSHYISPYTGQRFPDMNDTSGKGQDSATTFFFGDTFSPPREYYNYWAQNKWGDPLFSADGTNITYGSHLETLKNYGITHYMCGAGVGNSTTGTSSPISGVTPSDNYFCISKIQDSYKK